MDDDASNPLDKSAIVDQIYHYDSLAIALPFLSLWPAGSDFKKPETFGKEIILQKVDPSLEDSNVQDEVIAFSPPSSVKSSVLRLQIEDRLYNDDNNEDSYNDEVFVVRELNGKIKDHKLVLKLLRDGPASNKQSAGRIREEAEAYVELKTLQGDVIPLYYGYFAGLDNHNEDVVCILLDYCGQHVSGSISDLDFEAKLDNMLDLSLAGPGYSCFTMSLQEQNL